MTAEFSTAASISAIGMVCRHALHFRTDSAASVQTAQLVDLLATDQVAEIANEFAGQQAAPRRSRRRVDRNDSILSTGIGLRPNG